MWDNAFQFPPVFAQLAKQANDGAVLDVANRGFASNAALVSFGIYLVLVFLLAWLAGARRKRNAVDDEFVDEYFLGSRKLGVWAFALTFAATSASGGSFVGFPSLIYTHGWVLALWIAGYMMVPLLAMGLLGKRLNQVGRISGAITIPDVIERRFASPLAGVIATLLIVVFFSYFLLAQFQAGSQILIALLSGVPAFDSAVGWTADLTAQWSVFEGTDPDYVLCLGVFALAVIVYVVYGGFRAVVWTDVMQGVIMFLGVVLLLGFALKFTGGLGEATRKLGQLTPPRFGQAELSIVPDRTVSRVVPQGTWVATPDGGLVRTTQRVTIEPDQGPQAVDVLILDDEQDRASIGPQQVDSALMASIVSVDAYAFGSQRKGVYLAPPGPHPVKAEGFLTVAAAFSFFIFWPFGATGQPSNMVRLMAFRDTQTLRISLVMVTLYFSFIYFSLVIIFCCARVLLPGMEAQSDRIMPEMALYSTRRAGVPWLAGLLLAAPFAAVMSSVDSFLLMISSSLVRDVYQRFVAPQATERMLKRVTYLGTTIVGLIATYGALHPPKYLQQIIVDASGFLSASFMAPVAFSLFWRRMTATGVIAGMLGGCMTHAIFSLKLKQLHSSLGWLEGLEVLNPLVWSLIVSALAVVVGSILTRPANESHVQRFFPD